MRGGPGVGSGSTSAILVFVRINAVPSLNVKEIFEISGRGTVVVTDRTYDALPALPPLRIGDVIDFRVAHHTVLRTVVAGIEHLDPWSPKHLFAVLLPPTITKQQIPLGAEIWTVPVETNEPAMQKVWLESGGPAHVAWMLHDNPGNFYECVYLLGASPQGVQRLIAYLCTKGPLTDTGAERANGRGAVPVSQWPHLVDLYRSEQLEQMHLQFEKLTIGDRSHPLLWLSLSPVSSNSFEVLELVYDPKGYFAAREDWPAQFSELVRFVSTLSLVAEATGFSFCVDDATVYDSDFIHHPSVWLTSETVTKAGALWKEAKVDVSP